MQNAISKPETNLIKHGSDSKTTNPKRFCPIIKPVSLIGDAWTLLIVKALLDEPRRFNQIKAEIPEITNRTLSARLKKLIDKDLILKIQTNLPSSQKSPSQSSYKLTLKGHGLKQVISEIEDFGNKFMC